MVLSKALMNNLKLHKKNKLIRTATASFTIDLLLKGQLKFLNKYYNVIAVSGYDKHLENVFKREGVNIKNVKMRREISLFSDIISLYKLFKLFKREKPHIVHSITPKAGLLSMIAAYLAGVPIRIHTFTGLIFPSKKGFLKQILIASDKILCYFATDVYPEGKGVKSDLINYNITSKPLKIISNGNINGINTNIFNPTSYSEKKKSLLKSKLNISNNCFVFIFVGRIVGDKGINELVTSFIKLEKTLLKKSKIKLLLVGNYEMKQDPLKKETINLIKSNKNIINVGFQNDVIKYYSIAHVFILPSYREGFPNVLLQAGAMNLPSIVSNVNGSNEIIKDGFNGIIIQPKNEKAIYNAMKKIILNNNYRKKLSKNSRRSIISLYNQKKLWNEILTEYKKLEKKIEF